MYVFLVVVEIPWVLTSQKSLREESVHDAAGVFADFLNKYVRYRISSQKQSIRSELLIVFSAELSRRRRFPPNCRRYHRTKSLRPVIRPSSSVRQTFSMLFSARFGAVVDTQSFLNLKFGMPLVHLKIEKYRLERARPVDGVDMVLTE